MREFERVGEVLSRTGRLPQVDAAVAEARAVWPEAVGANVARHSTPVRLKGTQLIVNCESSTWAAELAMLEPRVREQLAKLVASPPSQLRFEVGRVEAPAPAAVPPPPMREASEEELRFAEAASANLQDEALREAVRTAIEASLRRES